MRRTSINRLFRTLLLVALFVTGIQRALAVSGFTPEQQAFLQQVIDGYTPWQTVELNGKLHSDRLPVSPSLKIFMERGKTLLISVRAPFIGEVGRLEVQGSTITAVNKMRKVYVREDLGALFATNLPIKIEDVQDLLLARAFLTRYGTLSADNSDKCAVYNESDCWLLVPEEQPADGAVRYGYTFDFSCRLQDLYITTLSENYAALFEYGYGGRKTSIEVNVQAKGKSYEARMQLDAPKWNPDKTLKAVEIDSRWNQVDIKTFIKSF